MAIITTETRSAPRSDRKYKISANSASLR